METEGPELVSSRPANPVRLAGCKDRTQHRELGSQLQYATAEIRIEHDHQARFGQRRYAYGPVQRHGDHPAERDLRCAELQRSRLPESDQGLSAELPEVHEQNGVRG